ncbi:polar growth protein [Ceratobasidium sp. 392]|nr:polar growth protein [Ceratobasidium sp. 392]
MESKTKGYVNTIGYKVIANENANPGQYGLMIAHDSLKPRFFSLDEQVIVREWMEELMMATIACNFNVGGFGSLAASLGYHSNAGHIGGLSGGYNGVGGYDSWGYERAGMAKTEGLMLPVSSAAPSRPSREMRPRMSKTVSWVSRLSTDEQSLLERVNLRLPPTCPLAKDLFMLMANDLILFRLAEAIEETDSGVPDSAFPRGPGDNRLEGLFKLFHFLLDNNVRIGAVSINNVCNGNGEKIAQPCTVIEDLGRETPGWTEAEADGGSGPLHGYHVMLDISDPCHSLPFASAFLVSRDMCLLSLTFLPSMSLLSLVSPPCRIQQRRCQILFLVYTTTTSDYKCLLRDLEWSIIEGKWQNSLDSLDLGTLPAAKLVKLAKLAIDREFKEALSSDLSHQTLTLSHSPSIFTSEGAFNGRLERYFGLKVAADDDTLADL